MKSILVTTMLVLATASLHAQANGVNLRTYGVQCRMFTESRIRASYDIRSTTLTVHVEPSVTCCNTFLSNQWLLIGTQIDPGIPLERLGFLTGCQLSVLPFIALPHVGPGANSWSFQLPPLVAGSAFYFQGVNDYFTTIGFSHDLQTSDALEVTIR